MNHKIATGLLSLSLLAGATALATMASGSPAAAVAAEPGGAAVTFYGTMERNTSWTQSQKVGFYSFTDTGEADAFTALTTQDTKLVTG